MSKKVLPVLFATLLVDMIGSGMVIPIIPILFTDASSPSFLLNGYSVSMQYFIAGAITAIFGILQFIAAPILGELSDVFGRKRLLALGVGTLAVAQMIFGFGITAGSLLLLFVSRAVAGLAGANFSIAQAAIADVSAPENRAKNFGLIGAAFGIGFILGPLLGGWIAHLGGAAAPFWFSGALGVLNLLFLTMFLPETHHNRAEAAHFHILKGINNIVAAFKDKDASPVYWASFLYMSGFAFLTTFSGIFTVQKYAFSEAMLGTYFGAVGAWVVVTQLFILPQVMKRASERHVLKVSLMVLALAVGVFPFMPNAIFQFLLLPFIAIPQGLSIATIGALISKSVGPGKQGAALGINGSLIALSQGLIPLLAGVASGLVGLIAPFIFGALLILLARAILFSFKRRAA